MIDFVLFHLKKYWWAVVIAFLIPSLFFLIAKNIQYKRSNKAQIKKIKEYKLDIKSLKEEELVILEVIIDSLNISNGRLLSENEHLNSRHKKIIKSYDQKINVLNSVGNDSLRGLFSKYLKSK